MKISKILLALLLIACFANSAICQTGEVVTPTGNPSSQTIAPSGNKKYEIGDEYIVEIKELKRTGQGALMTRFQVTSKKDNRPLRVYATGTKLTDLSSKAVYHVMEGSGTDNSHSVNPWAMITEPPVSLKSALLTIQTTDLGSLPPVLIDLP